MTFAVQMLTYVSATIGAKCVEIPRFINYFFGKIDKLRTRYDVTGIIYEAFCRHLVAAIQIIINVSAKCDANRAKIASAMNISFYTWKKPMIP